MAFSATDNASSPFLSSGKWHVNRRDLSAIHIVIATVSGSLFAFGWSKEKSNARLRRHR